MCREAVNNDEQAATIKNVTEVFYIVSLHPSYLLGKVCH